MSRFTLADANAAFADACEANTTAAAEAALLHMRRTFTAMPPPTAAQAKECQPLFPFLEPLDPSTMVRGLALVQDVDDGLALFEGTRTAFFGNVPTRRPQHHPSGTESCEETNENAANNSSASLLVDGAQLYLVPLPGFRGYPQHHATGIAAGAAGTAATTTPATSVKGGNRKRDRASEDMHGNALSLDGSRGGGSFDRCGRERGALGASRDAPSAPMTDIASGFVPPLEASLLLPHPSVAPELCRGCLAVVPAPGAFVSTHSDSSESDNDADGFAAKSETSGRRCRRPRIGDVVEVTGFFVPVATPGSRGVDTASLSAFGHCADGDSDGGFSGQMAEALMTGPVDPSDGGFHAERLPPELVRSLVCVSVRPLSVASLLRRLTMGTQRQDAPRVLSSLPQHTSMASADIVGSPPHSLMMVPRVPSGATLRERRNSVLSFLARALGGDSLAARYLLCHLCSGVRSRRCGTVTGDLPLRLVAPSVAAAEAVETALRSLALAGHVSVPVAAAARAGARFWPEKDVCDTGAVRPGLLQLHRGCQLTLRREGTDEAKVSLSGTGVPPMGRKPTAASVATDPSEALSALVHTQRVRLGYDGGSSNSFEVWLDSDVQVLVLEVPQAGNVAGDVPIPAWADLWCTVPFEHTETAETPPTEETAGDAMMTAADVARCIAHMRCRAARRVLRGGGKRASSSGAAATAAAAYETPDVSSAAGDRPDSDDSDGADGDELGADVLAADMVNEKRQFPRRFNNTPVVHNNTISGRMSLARCVATACGTNRISASVWQEVKHMEAERCRRLGASS